jgi:hypothetical protein
VGDGYQRTTATNGSRRPLLFSTRRPAFATVSLQAVRL